MAAATLTPLAFWHDQLVAHHKQALFLVIAGFVGSFAFIRISTRIQRSPRLAWWPGSIVSDSGVHLHHLVFGIVAMLAGGTVGFAMYNSSPELEICAAAFGIGAGLTIDEFALWVHLDDVYWTEEGRSSIDAAVIATALMALIFLEVRPFQLSKLTPVDVAWTVAAPIVLAAVLACFAKGRFLHGAMGFFLWPLAAYGAVRLGKPRSPWARRFYGERNQAKEARARERFRPDRRTERWTEAFRDAVGGTPTEVYEAKLARRAGGSPPSTKVKPKS